MKNPSLSLLPKETFHTQHLAVVMQSVTPLWHITPCILCLSHTLDHTHGVDYKNKRPHKHYSPSSLRNPRAIGGNRPAPASRPSPPTGAVPSSVWFGLGDRWPTQSRYLPSNRNPWLAQRPYLHKQSFTSAHTVQGHASKQCRLEDFSVTFLKSKNLKWTF